jgi:hypothetical protein
MQVDDKNNKVVFSNGKEMYAYAGIVSILNNEELVYGYDGTFGYLPGYWDEEVRDLLTPEECVEIADYMINQWKEFRERYTQCK